MIQCVIHVYSHGICVSSVSTTALPIIKQFAYRLIQFKFEKAGGKFHKVADRVYAASDRDRTEFRFIRSQLDELLQCLRIAGIGDSDISIIHVPLYIPAPATMKMPTSWVARDNQVPIIEYVTGGGHIKTITLQTGQGKALSMDSKIKVPGGWALNRDMYVGRDIAAPDGSVTKVTGVYPQGEVELYRITFADGRYVDACGEHLWKTNYGVICTNAIRELLDDTHVVEIPRCALEQSSERTLAVANIVPIGKGEAQCISVDHPDSLYITNDFIVTHNTAISLKSAEIIGHRLVIIVLGRYFEKWIGDVESNYGLGKGKLVACRGFKQVKALMQLAYLDELSADVVIITSTSMHDYIKAYEETKFQDMPDWLVPPHKFYELLKAGVRIVDEAHQHFHLNYMMDVYAHLPKTLNLSATLESDDRFIDGMLRTAYPLSTRMDGGGYIKYCHCTALHYKIAEPNKIKFKGRTGAYSHVVLEQWIMKRPKLLDNYLKMIFTALRKEYLDKKVDGQRALILAATVDLCEIIANYIDERTDELIVNKYTSEEDYEVLMKSDISVSTYGSAGTAVDIDGLLVTFMTTAMSNRQANMQALGRLRELRKYPDQKPMFVYFVCDDIPKHREYHEKKREMFVGKVLTHNDVYYDEKI